MFASETTLRGNAGALLMRLSQLLSLLLLFGQLVHAEPLALASFACDITFVNEHEAVVTAHMALDNAGGTSEITLRLVRYPDQTINDVRIHVNEHPASVRAVAEKGATSVSAALPLDPLQPGTTRTLTVRYAVLAQPGPIVRIPLPVMDHRAAFRERPAQISINLPDGTSPVGDVFPAFTWTDARHGSVELVNVPSIAIIHIAPLGAASLMSRFSTATNVTDGAMLALVLAGSSLWWARSRRPRTKYKATANL